MSKDLSGIMPPEPQRNFNPFDAFRGHRRGGEKGSGKESDIKVTGREKVSESLRKEDGSEDLNNRVGGLRAELAREREKAEKQEKYEYFDPVKGLPDGCGFETADAAVKAYDAKLTGTLASLKTVLKDGDYLKIEEDENGKKIYDPVLVDSDIPPDLQRLEARMQGLGNAIESGQITTEFLERLPRRLYANLIVDALEQLAADHPRLMLFSGGKDDSIINFSLSFENALADSGNNKDPRTKNPFLRFSPTIKLINVAEFCRNFREGGINILPRIDGRFTISDIDSNNPKLAGITRVFRAPDVEDKAAREKLLMAYKGDGTESNPGKFIKSYSQSA